MGIKRKWAALLKNCVFHFGKAEGKRTLAIKRYVANRSHYYDEDNLVAGLKPIIDNLVKEGVFKDDTPALLTVDKPTQEVGRPRVEIHIKNAQPGPAA